MDKKEQSWEQEVIWRFLKIALGGILLAIIGLILRMFNLQHFADAFMGVGMVIAMPCGIFGLAGLIVEGW